MQEVGGYKRSTYHRKPQNDSLCEGCTCSTDNIVSILNECSNITHSTAVASVPRPSPLRVIVRVLIVRGREAFEIGEGLG